MDEMIMPYTADSAGTSWVYIILFTLFCLCCIRTKGDSKFVGSIIRNIIGVKERENLFDVTVRETSFIILALLLSACSIGVLLCIGVNLYSNRICSAVNIPGIALQYNSTLIPMAVCMGIACVYIGVMWLIYYLVALVFSDNTHAHIWVRGFTSAMSLGGLLFFPLALTALAYPAYAPMVTLIGLGVLIFVKFAFIIKGFRIFFTESSSWVVFLYYLCNLEIIPLNLTYGLACSLLG